MYISQNCTQKALKTTDVLEVAISTGHDEYPLESPYSPSVDFPEYPFRAKALAHKDNSAYVGIRDTLRLLNLDADNFKQENWNPFGEIICPGNTVVLKPNFIRGFRETQAGHDNCLITHGAIIRAAIDYVYIALEGTGRIVIADASQNDADFDEIRQIAGLEEIQEFYRQHANFEIEIYDLRPEKARKVNGVIVGHEKLPGDPAGYVKVKLNHHSEFCKIRDLCHMLYGAEYDTGEIHSHHHDDTHEYLISKTILDADCVINLPKLKTHKKTGITACMKNLVGVNGNKNWLPHHREGTPSQGGDQFADDGILHRIEQRAMACFRSLFPLLGPLRGIIAGPLKALGKGIFGDTNTNTIRSGNWYGNDTTWRMVIDLNRIIVYADKNGKLQDRPARNIFCIVDGIIGGEGNGPLDSTPKQAGVILAGKNPVAVDLACARLMGFNYNRLPMLHQALKEHLLPISSLKYENVICRSDNQLLNLPLVSLDKISLDFRPHFGWRNHI